MSALIQLAQMKIQLALVQKQLPFWTQLAYNFRHWLYLSKFPQKCWSHGNCISILHTQVNITAPRSLQVFFINGSPLVEGNTVRADIMATVTGASFMCELLRKNSPPMMADCEW